MEGFSRFLLPGGLFLVTVASGYWLSHSGRPLSGALITVHKLIALATVVLAGVQFARLLKASTPALAVGLLVLAVISALALFATGAMLSQAKPAAQFVLRIHQIAPLLLLISSAASAVLWLGGKL